jgi:hypothetical protein
LKRQLRQEINVLPELKEMEPQCARQATLEAKLQTLPGKKVNIKAIQDWVSKRTATLVSTPAVLIDSEMLTTTPGQLGEKESALIKKYSTQTIPTAAIAIVPQLIVFMATTQVLHFACQPPTPLDSESFFTLSTLIHPDTTTVLPVALGLITLINFETMHWWWRPYLKQSQFDAMREASEKRVSPERQGEQVVAVKFTSADRSGARYWLTRTGLRGVTIFRLLWAATEPGVRLFLHPRSFFSKFTSSFRL